jgi:hypothetical protein
MDLEGVQRIVTRYGWNKRLLAQVTGAVAAAYTAPTGFTATVTSIVICNTGGATTFTIHHSDTGAAAAAGNALFSLTAIAANTTSLVVSNSDSSGLTIAPGGIIYAGSASGTVTISLYGYEESAT